MKTAQKQFSVNRGASKKQVPISNQIQSLGLGQTVGLDELHPDQEIWRFMPWHRAKDLIFKNEIYLSSINTLREIDLRECRLPEILSQAVVASPADYHIKEFMLSSFNQIEAHADIVFASCWFLPPDSSIEEERGMWKEFCNHPEGGIRIRSTIRSLVMAIPDTERSTFGLGRIHYLPNSIRATEAFNLKGQVLPGQYLSNPFLLKVEKYHKERELRLFHRWTRCTSKEARFWTPPCDDGANELEYWITDDPLAGLRIKVRRTILIHGLCISRHCSDDAQARIHEVLVNFGFPASQFDISAIWAHV